MRYLPTLNVWQPAIQTAIQSGQIKLQRGQWLICGNNEHRCRFVGLMGNGSLWVTHWQGNSKDTYSKFISSVNCFKNKKLRS